MKTTETAYENELIQDMNVPGTGSDPIQERADPVKGIRERFSEVAAAATLSRVRMAVQACFALFCLYAGYRFYQFYLWAIGQSEIYVPRPSSVEAFLPISALLALKRFVLTAKWDEIHPAGLTILIGAIVVAIVARKGFCGWICPVGFTSNLVEKMGRLTGFMIRLPRWLDYPLLSIKYLILGFFMYAIFWTMNLDAVEAFLFSTFNLVADAKMLEFFLYPSRLTLQVLAILFLLSLFIRNFWCRYLCPYGALLGLGSLVSPLRIKRNPSLCMECGKCDDVCPAAIGVSHARTVRHPECVGCGECVEVCPRQECLQLQGYGRKKLSLYLLPAAVVGIFLLVWMVAVVTGNWHTDLPPEMFQRLYPVARAVPHP
jgi:polyferredoxin